MVLKQPKKLKKSCSKKQVSNGQRNLGNLPLRWIASDRAEIATSERSSVSFEWRTCVTQAEWRRFVSQALLVSIGVTNFPSHGSHPVVHFCALGGLWCQSVHITMTSVAPNDPCIHHPHWSLFSWHWGGVFYGVVYSNELARSWTDVA